MNVGETTRLDKEDEKRFQDVWKEWNETHSFDRATLFKYKSIAASLETPKVLFSRFEIDKFLLSLPFNGTVFAVICPHCPVKERELKPLLESRHFVPILIGNYQDYSIKITSQIAKYPHISRQEFAFYRFAQLSEQAKAMVCSHCVQLKRREILALLRKAGGTQRDFAFAEFFIGNLWPFIDPDYELIDEFAEAVKRKRKNRIKKLVQISDLLEHFRSAQSMKAGLTISLDELETAAGVLKVIAPATDQRSLPQLQAALASDLGLIRPRNMPIDKYLQIVMSHKEKLCSISETLLAETGTPAKASLGALHARIATINDEIRSAQTSRRYMALKAGIGFVKTNPVLVGTLLVGGAFGACGSLMGCGATAILAGGAKAVASKIGKPKLDADSKAFLGSAAKGLREQLNPLVARYLNIDIRSLQVMQIREEIEGTQNPK